MDELPEAPEELEKLARRLGFEPKAELSAADRFLERLDETTTRIRNTFDQLIERERNTPTR
jgi:glutamine synthetase adenylyltransferase